jgi:ABC-type lipoprotein release transport system permease subunit
MSDGVGLVGVGLALGCASALAGSSHLQALLHRVPARDPVVYVAVIGGLLVTAVLACAIPSLQAARIDPVRTLQAE